jgi:hypothetical protein
VEKRRKLMRQGTWLWLVFAAGLLVTLLIVFVAGLLVGWGVSRVPVEGRAEAQQGGAQWEYKFVPWKVTKDTAKNAANDEEVIAAITKLLNKQLVDEINGSWEYSGYSIPAGASNSLPLFKRLKR